MNRIFNVVLCGATGFIGQQAAAYFAEHFRNCYLAN